MPYFDIVKTCDIDKTFRVSHVMGDFDVDVQHVKERFVGEINYTDDWHIGVIVGGSGTGKSTIAKQLFPDSLFDNFNYNHKSVIDDMPDNVSVSDIEKMFYAIGFGSVPSWLKPYKVLSNGEKMRVDLASALLSHDFVVFDEFTSVVDRQVAKTASLAISKAVRNNNKQFVAISCHYDILEWLQPDWVYDTNANKCFFTIAHDRNKNLKCENVGAENGKSLGDIII